MSKPPFYHTDTGSTKSSAVYHSVPTLSTPTFQAPHATSQPIDESLLPSRKRKLIGRVALVTTALILCLVGPIIAWAWYVFIHKHTTIDWRNLVVKTTANPSQFLLVSAVSSTVSKIFAAPLISLYAYSAAADWIKSTAVDDKYRQPCPTHLAFLLSLFLGASFSSLAAVGFSGVQGCFVARRRQPPWPPMLRKVIALLAWLLFLLYSLNVINIWLSAVAIPIPDAPLPADMLNPGRMAKDTQFSRVIDKALCQEKDADGIHKHCGTEVFPMKKYDQSPVLQSQITDRILSNLSDIARVAWLDDNTAILVTSARPVFGYKARALGVRSMCRSITNKCTECEIYEPDTGTSCEGWKEAGPEINCTASTSIHVATNRNRYLPLGPVGTYTGESPNQCLEFGGNPFTYADILISLAYFNESLAKMDHFVGTTGFLWWSSNRQAIGVMSCQVSVYDVDYQFTLPDNYTVVRSTLTDKITSDYVAAKLNYDWATQIGIGFQRIDGEGLSGGATYPEIYGRLLSKIAIASTSSILPPSPAEELLGGQASGTSVTLIGMALLAAVLCLIIVTTIIIGVHAAFVIIRTDSKFLAAARGRLISIYPLIGDSFGGLKADPDSHVPAVSAALGEKAFLRESEADRLQLVQEPLHGGSADGMTVRLRPRKVGRVDDGTA